MAKATYSKPASQVDLEERQKKDYVPPSVLGQGVDPEPSENGFVATDPVYQGRANATERPVKITEGAEAKVLNEFIADDAEFPEDDEEPVEEEKKESKSTSSNPPSGSGQGN